MKQKLYQQLKNVVKWVYNQALKAGEAISDSEERFYFGKVEKRESNKE